MFKIKEDDLKYLSFPDSVVEKMDFSPVKKTIRIYVDSAWLDLKSGVRLNKGLLFFEKWASLSVNRYLSGPHKWEILEENKAEAVRDFAEFVIDKNNITFAGFGKESGQWIEWSIAEAKIHAEFEN